MRRLLWPLLAISCVDAAPCADDLCLVPHTIPLLVAPRTALPVDLDHDGLLDLVGLAGPALTVRLATTDPTRTPAALHALPDDGLGLVAADLDGDGRLDLATAVPTRGAIVWLPADAAPRTIDLDAAIRTLVAADLDRDGTADLIAGPRDDGGLHVLRGGPDGPMPLQVIPGGTASALAVGDLDADNLPDVLAAVPEAGAVQRHTADSTGRLTAAADVWRTSFPTAVALADLDADGALDIAAADPLERTVLVARRDRADVWPLDLEPQTILPRRGPAGLDLALTDGATLTLLDPRTGRARVTAYTHDPATVLHAVDLDGDAIDELLFGESRLVEVPGFVAHRRWHDDTSIIGPLLLLDLDGDGPRELVAHDRAADELVTFTIAHGAPTEHARVPAPAGLDGLRAIDRGDHHDLAWWADRSYGVYTFTEDTLTALTDRTLAEHYVVDLAGEADHLHVAATRYDLTATSVVLRVALTADPTPEQVYTGPQITSLALAAADDLWIAHTAGVTRVHNSVAALVAPLRDLTGALVDDLDADGTLEIAGCRPDGPLLAGSTLTRLSDLPCTRIEACDLDADGAPELLAIRDAGKQGLVPTAGLEILARTGTTWTSRGSLSLGPHADPLALACDDLSVWTGGDRGLARAELRPGPALRAARARSPAAPPLLGDLDGDARDELIAHDGHTLLLARASADAFAPVRPIAAPGPGQPVALAELDGTAGAEILARVTDLAGAVHHDIWTLHADTMARTGRLALADWELLADFDGDARDDLIVRAPDNTRALLHPDALGRFTPLPLELTDLELLRAADMDRDGRADLLTYLPDTDDTLRFTVLRSRGDGFAPARLWPLRITRQDLRAVALGDLDADGSVDLAHFDPVAQQLLVCPGDGHGGPAAPCRVIPWADQTSAVPPVIVDLDGDGARDLVLSRMATPTPVLQLLRGLTTGHIDPTEPLPVPIVGTLRRARLADGRTHPLLLGTGEAVLLTEPP